MNLKEWLKCNHITYRAAEPMFKISAGSIEKIANQKTWPTRGTAKRIVEVTGDEVGLYDLYNIERTGHH